VRELLVATLGCRIEWGRFAYASRCGAGFAFLRAGLMLEGIAIALGG